MGSAEPFKVMVIGDGAAARDALLAFLRAVGFVAEHGGGAEAAVDAIRQREFDLALLDIENSIGISATELCGQIRATGKPVGILLMTPAQVEKEIVGALEAGADDYISKPFRTADLISRCHVVLHRVRANNALERNSFVVGDFHLDVDRRQLRKASKVVSPRAHRVQLAHIPDEEPRNGAHSFPTPAYDLGPGIWAGVRVPPLLHPRGSSSPTP